jgi:hypothetical protein
MPEISRFLGMIITMYPDDHNPPHFHVRYNQYNAIIEIKTLGLIDGSLPTKVRALAIEWASLHQEELLMDWELLSKHQAPKKIAPLE